MDDSSTITLSLPADYKYLHVLGAVIESLIAPYLTAEATGTTYNIQLALHEVGMHVIEQAYRNDANQRLHIALRVDPETHEFFARVSDQGKPLQEVTSRSLEAEKGQGHRLGLFIVYQLMDHVHYEGGEISNQWILKKKLSI